MVFSISGIIFNGQTLPQDPLWVTGRLSSHFPGWPFHPNRLIKRVLPLPFASSEMPLTPVRSVLHTKPCEVEHTVQVGG